MAKFCVLLILKFALILADDKYEDVIKAMAFQGEMFDGALRKLDNVAADNLVIVQSFNKVVEELGENRRQVRHFQRKVENLGRENEELRNTLQLVAPCLYNLPDYFLVSGKCYYFEKQALSFDQAQQNCRGKFLGKGKLFEPRSKDQNQKVFAKASGYFLQRGQTIWLGIDDRIMEDDHVYSSSGQSLPFINWNFNEPSKETKPLQDCVYMGYGDQYKWSDVECNTIRASICEE